MKNSEMWSIGARTNAEFHILLSKTVGEGLEIVLGQRLPDGWYVTWECSGGTNYYWGHYFSGNQLLEAMADFMERCGDHGVQTQNP